MSQRRARVPDKAAERVRKRALMLLEAPKLRATKLSGDTDECRRFHLERAQDRLHGGRE